MFDDVYQVLLAAAPSLPKTAALAAVALLGYMVGRWKRMAPRPSESQMRRQFERAQVVAQELEQISNAVRKNLSRHNASISKFKDRLRQLGAQDDETLSELCREAEEVLRPTLRLASEMARAYDSIREQTTHLMAFTEVRTDPLTGVRNRRGLDETLETLLAMKARYDQAVTVAILDIDNFKQINDDNGHLHGDRVLQAVATMLDEGIRTTDVLGRFGGEEFVLVMPSTDLEGAVGLTERLRHSIAENPVVDLKVTLSAGVATAMHGETAQSVLARADEALYQAKDSGRNCVMYHTGESIVAIDDTVPATTAALAEPPPSQPAGLLDAPPIEAMETA